MGSNENNPLLLIEERRKRQQKYHQDSELAPSYLGCKWSRDSQRISRSIFHKAKVFSGHLRVFLTSTLGFFPSRLFYFITSIPGGERNKPRTVKKEGKKEEANVRTG